MTYTVKLKAQIEFETQVEAQSPAMAEELARFELRQCGDISNVEATVTTGTAQGTSIQ